MVWANGFVVTNTEHESTTFLVHKYIFIENQSVINVDLYFGIKAVFHISQAEWNLEPAQSERIRQRSNAPSHGECWEYEPTGGFGPDSSGRRQRVCTLNRPPSRWKKCTSSANISADGAFLQSEHGAIYIYELKYEQMCIHRCETNVIKKQKLLLKSTLSNAQMQKQINTLTVSKGCWRLFFFIYIENVRSLWILVNLSGTAWLTSKLLGCFASFVWVKLQQLDIIYPYKLNTSTHIGEDIDCVIGCECIGLCLRVYAYVMSVLALNSKGLARG